MTAEKSWIPEVRRWLAAHPVQQPLITEVERRAVLIPLLVEGSELWTVLTQPTSAGSEPAFPGGPIQADEEA